MDKPIIRVEGLGKQYRIGARELKYKTIREALVDAVVSPFRRLNGNVRSAVEEVESHIWALKDVSLDVQRGEVLGIIGRNGAGKSTLLKILSRITEPTEGRIEVRGRVASLLEVGTGFHGELTGRENVYLNGAIMGMRKLEIDRKFDEMVAFAEVEKFVDRAFLAGLSHVRIVHGSGMGILRKALRDYLKTHPKWSPSPNHRKTRAARERRRWN